jgi:hypothetical protein
MLTQEEKLKKGRKVQKISANTHVEMLRTQIMLHICAAG